MAMCFLLLLFAVSSATEDPEPIEGWNSDFDVRAATLKQLNETYDNFFYAGYFLGEDFEDEDTQTGCFVVELDRTAGEGINVADEYVFDNTEQALAALDAAFKGKTCTNGKPAVKIEHMYRLSSCACFHLSYRFLHF